MADPLSDLSDQDVSIWLDDISRERLRTGNLAELMANKRVVGVTSNPTIFAKAMEKGDAYDEQARELATRKIAVDGAIRYLMAYDIRWACDVLRPVYDRTGGKDGRVSIEVDPRISHDAERTTAEAKGLHWLVDRPNVMIKIPATEEGLQSITEATAAGIDVNITLIFGLDRYDLVMEAYLAGLEQAQANGIKLQTIHSVASFFVSRVDTEIDKRLDATGDPQAGNLMGLAGIANARLAYEAFEEKFSGDRFLALKDAGANVQRPLWASTGVKNPDYRDTMYVTDLVVSNTVNTMPEKTLQAFADHGEVKGDQVTTKYDEARQVMDDLKKLGIDYDDVIETLENEGVDKFVKSWDELVETVRGQLDGARGGSQEGAK
jgi:transaldolase